MEIVILWNKQLQAIHKVSDEHSIRVANSSEEADALESYLMRNRNPEIYKVIRTNIND
jgi:hypothetical protein